MFIEMSLRRPRPHVKRTALIVDSDPDLQRSMSKQLGRMNFHVLSANHFEAAVRHLATGELHLACVDVQLPSKSGFELCEHIRCSLGLVGLPILVTSAYGNPEDIAYAEAAGGNAFLRKPFSMRELAHCVESLLAVNRGNAPSMREQRPCAAR